MTLRHMKIFIAVYREMNISKAAEKIHLAQPSVSLAIKELEDHYHAKFFERINHKLFITQKGEEFYSFASHMISLYEDMEQTLLSSEPAASLSLGSSITIGSFITPKVTAYLKSRYPASDIYVSIQNSQKIIQHVLHNELDAGLVEDKISIPQLAQIPFRKSRLCFVCGKDNPLCLKKDLTLEEISQYPFYLREPGSASREIPDGLFKSYQLKTKIVCESVSNQALISAIKESDGISVLPETIIKHSASADSLHILPCHPDAFNRNFLLIYHKNKLITPILNELIQSIHNF